MNCQNCGAPMRLILEKRQYVCNHCTTSFFPEENKDGVQILGEQSHSMCPVCKNSRLMFATIADKTILHCKECRGILLQLRELMLIVQTLRSQRPPDAAVIPPPVNHEEKLRKISCPVCKNSMDTYLYGGGGNVHVDSCIHCGVIWLDYRELKRIVEAPTRPKRATYQSLWEQQGIHPYADRHFNDDIDLWNRPSVLTSSINTILEALF